MIAGKTEVEIGLMPKSTRSKWYKIILSKEKEEAMQMMENIRRAKNSISKIGKNNPMYGETHSEETRIKQSVAMTECWKDLEYRDNLSGENHYMYDKHHTEEAKAKRSKLLIEYWKDPEYRDNHSGENNPSWQGGKSFEPYGIEFNNDLKEQIRKRDNYICQMCDKIQEEVERKLDVHHIDYDKTNNDPENLISLCRACHIKTNYNREDWIEYFR